MTENKIWEIAPRKLDDIVDQILFNRKIVDLGVEDADKLRFFEPNFEKDLFDPFLMKNMKAACERIKEAKEKGEKIGIFADYDADGIPGAALLYKTMRAIGIEAAVYIPNREGGYGLSKEGIDYLVGLNCKLIITVDLGIRSLEEADYCKKIGIDLIITDHHLPGEDLPDARILINPKQNGDKYPYKELCGCGVAYKLLQGLAHYFPESIDEKFRKWTLDLVAISTVSDVVPLTGENRVLAKYGLIVVQKTKNLGLRALIEIAKIVPEEIGAYHLGFQIGPRINAPGRIDHATKSFELLITEDESEAKELAKWLDEKNTERQEAMDRTQKEAILQIEKNNLGQNKVIVVAGDWQKGVIGPSASKLVEKYGRPIILFAKDKDCLVGSARSISSVNIVELFEQCEEYIKKFGGHKGAAGITVMEENFESFVKLLEREAGKIIKPIDLIPKVKIDAEVKLSELTKSLYEEIIHFEPFGMGNPRPVFMISNSKLNFGKFVGKNKDHLSAVVGENPHRFKIIHFYFPYEKEMIKSTETYDLAFTLSLDEWQGEKNLSLNIQDIRVSGKD
ncbi:MAG: single-stranded-DNA-specific exonuclease RecJ [Candidatus Berkelbacteria bacterium]|nr:single-stranded-DNA-specific exonuclease RecJ [Candidatus Berkelbacteria bacterium]